MNYLHGQSNDMNLDDLNKDQYVESGLKISQASENIFRTSCCAVEGGDNDSDCCCQNSGIISFDANIHHLLC